MKLFFTTLLLISTAWANAQYIFPEKDKINTITNPGMEDDFTSSWMLSTINGGNGSYKLSTAVKRNGNNALMLSKTNSFGYVKLSSRKKITVAPGEVYTFRFWFNASTAQVTSFLIPRIVVDDNASTVTNPFSALWVDFDYDSQSFMRNSPSTKAEDWIKRVVFYENKTTQPQDVFIQLMLYGNPFDVYVDDLEFIKGKIERFQEPVNPAYNFTEEQAMEIVLKRKEETANFSFKNNASHFYLNGKEEWPIFYRAWPSNKSADALTTAEDPAGFAAQGININNVILEISDYGLDSLQYNWQKSKAAIMNILRKNPNAKLLIDFAMDPDADWQKKYPSETWTTKDGRKLNAVSYSSAQWRRDGTAALQHLIADMKKDGIWKIVVGANVPGGHDAQFWTKVIGEYAADYSPSHLYAWQQYLKENYKTIDVLNKTWQSNYASFENIPIADATDANETLPAIMQKGAVPDFRQFCEAAAFDTREIFAKAIKDEAGKPFFVSAYGMPMENQHERFLNMNKTKSKANDLIISMSYYPFRQPGFASGYHPEQSFGYHNTSFMQELDLRYYVFDKTWYDELVQMWCGTQANIAAWKNMHRKLVGISLAQNQGFWYYDMDKQFVDKDVLNEVGVVKKIADKLITRKGVSFKPDVCLIRFGAESRYYGSSVDNAVGATNQWQYMMLETSGVPYDVHYLADIMNNKELQEYKVFIFHNSSFISAVQRQWINTHLKNNKRTIIWMYDSGYDTEDGLSATALSKLTGMQVQTKNEYARGIFSIAGKDKLSGGISAYKKVPSFQGMAEALCGIFTTNGITSTQATYKHKFGYKVAPGVSRYQKFWIADKTVSVLGKYIDDNKTALAVKRFANWTSIYIAAPNALAGEMMNNIAKEAGAYRAGPSALGELRMSGRFVSYHALRTGKYIFNLPKGATKIMDAETGKVLAANVSNFVIDGVAQNTYWYFLE